ncbi:hypothetical protein NE237_023647 [Protea cynaroides]|uniref:Uncharacterized protein n=1 Tax=Protea cynaroides TaxID=273540 RepID=A0A9Q0K6Q9_9MAGN|nr:hypothetical protein NE237_023647 [Protea cynaroides]
MALSICFCMQLMRGKSSCQTLRKRNSLVESNGPDDDLQARTCDFDIPPAQCLQNFLEFLKQRKMQVSRSSSVLNNPNQALRLLSSCDLLSKNLLQPTGMV